MAVEADQQGGLQAGQGQVAIADQGARQAQAGFRQQATVIEQMETADGIGGLNLPSGSPWRGEMHQALQGDEGAQESQDYRPEDHAQE